MTFPIQIILAICLAVGSIIFGFRLGVNWQKAQFTKEIREEFVQKFYNRFVEEYEKAVEERAKEIVDENFERWNALIEEEAIGELKKEKENENESAGSN